MIINEEIFFCVIQAIFNSNLLFDGIFACNNVSIKIILVWHTNIDRYHSKRMWAHFTHSRQHICILSTIVACMTSKSIWFSVCAPYLLFERKIKDKLPSN